MTMVFDPLVGQRAWPGGPPVGAIYAMQAAAQAEAERTAAEREAELRRAKAAMRASGATCQVECARGEGGFGQCGVAAVGRCAACQRGFCESHQSVDRAESVGGAVVSRVASSNECGACHKREFTDEVKRSRAAYEAAEARRRAQREQAEQERRQHAEAVAVREAETGWEVAQIRVAQLSRRIAKLQPRNPASAGQVVVAALVGVVDLVLLAMLRRGAVAGDSERAVLALLGLMVVMWPTVWAAGIAVKLVRQLLRRGYIDECDQLLQARGCGDPTCGRCE